MNLNISSQYDFFKNVKLDNDGNLCVVLLSGGTGGNNYYTTGATLNNTTVYFDRTDALSAYTLDLSSFSTASNVDGGNASSINIYMGINGGGA